MLLSAAHTKHEPTKRSGAASMYSCVRQGQPSTDRFAGILLNWEDAGP